MTASGKKLSLLATLVLSLVGLTMFQNCSPNKVQFSASDSAAEASTVVLPPVGSDPFQADPFGFNDQSSVTPGSAVTSNSVTLKGSGAAPVSAVCSGCFLQKNNSGTFTETLPQINQGDVLTIRLTAPSSYSSSLQATVKVGSVTSKLWTVTTQAAPNSGCASNAGQTCDKGTSSLQPGCGPDYGCADFVGIYYNSPNGCESSTASSWIEYYFDGAKHYARSSNDPNPSVTGDTTSSYHCTYVGFSSSDNFHNIPNGSCFNSSAAGFGIENTYTRVVPGSGCYHMEHTVVPGTVRCDGSCQ